MKTPRGLNEQYPRACTFIRAKRKGRPYFFPAPVAGVRRRPVYMKYRWAAGLAMNIGLALFPRKPSAGIPRVLRYGRES